MGRRARFAPLVILDGANVLAVVVRARRRAHRHGPAAGRIGLASGAVGTATWALAVAALHAVDRADEERARRLVRAGAVLDAAGTATVLAASSRRSGRLTSEGRGESLYLLIGGLIISSAYLAVLRRR